MWFREEVQKMPRPSLEQKLGKRERVLKTFAGLEVDRRPFTFWLPFGLTHMKGESLAAAALTFAATYGVDLLRLPVVRDLPLKEQTSLDRAHDLTQLEVLSERSGFWLERLEALQMCKKMSEQKIAIFETIPEPWTGLSYLCRRELLSSAENNNLSFMEKALGDITISLKHYISGVIKAKCVDGIVIEIESATFEQREPAVFEARIKPFLKDLINHITQESELPIWLHVRGTRVYLEPLMDLHHQMVSWPHLSSGPKLENALPKGYKGNLAGGLDEKAIPDMSYQDIRRHVEEARNLRVAMLCVGDALPTDLSPSRLKALATFLAKRDRIPDKNAPKAAPMIDEA